MHLRPGTLGMTAMLAMLTALGPISTDLYLPSLPSMARTLDTDLSRVQLTLSAYLLGFAAGQIFYGPVSDRLGRKPVILAGLALYCVASIACVVATSVDVLIAARFVQALGAAGPIVLGRAIVRDLYDGPSAARELSRMGMLMGLVPAIAPVLGGVLEPLFGWRSAFLALLTGGVALAACVVLLLPETIRERRKEPVSLGQIFRSFGVVIRNASFRRYAMLAGFSYGGLFAFISGSSFVLQGSYGLTPLQFGLSFALGVLGYISGTIIAQRLVGSWGIERTIGLGVAALATGGLAMLALAVIRTGNPLELVLPLAVYAAGVGLVLPQANAGGMMPFPDRAGAASSLSGLIQSTFSALTGALLGLILDGRPLMMPIAIAAMGVGAAALYLFGRSRTSVAA